MHADLLEHDRQLLRRRYFAWSAASLAAVTCAGWMLQAPVRASLHHVLSPALEKPEAEAPAAAAANPEDAPSMPPVRAEPIVQTRPLSAWLTDVARDAGRDLVLSPEVRGDLTATHGSRLSWEQRLAAFGRVFGFDFAISDGLIEIAPLAAARGSRGQDRAHPASRDRADADAMGDVAAPPLAALRESGAAAPAAQLAGPGAAGGAAAASAPAAPGEKPQPPVETRVAALAHVPAKELAAVLAKAAEPLGVAIVADPVSNALLISGVRSAIDRASLLLRDLDRPRRRVLLEAKIVELTHSARLDLGVEWKVSGDVGADVKFPPPVAAAGRAAIIVATGGAYALDARISAMEAAGRVRVVSRPSVTMLEGSPATVESVRILRIRLPSRGSVVGDDVVQVDNGTRATEEIPVGVRLEVTPAIRAGHRVLLRIKAKSSSLGAPLPPDDIPEELSRMVDAELEVGDGETAVLGGLQRESGERNAAGVPGLRSVPVLGTLFGRRTREREAEELLVMVTPRVLD